MLTEIEGVENTINIKNIRELIYEASEEFSEVFKGKERIEHV